MNQLNIDNLPSENKNLIECLHNEQIQVRGGQFINSDSFISFNNRSSLSFSIEYVLGTKSKGGSAKLTLDKNGKNIVNQTWTLK